eukprot:1194870-Prorocentrum_minimum.AAC.4
MSSSVCAFPTRHRRLDGKHQTLLLSMLNWLYLSSSQTISPFRARHLRGPPSRIRKRSKSRPAPNPVDRTITIHAVRRLSPATAAMHHSYT